MKGVYISGELEGLGFKHYLRETVDGYVWTNNILDRKVFTFEDACEVFDEVFLEGKFKGMVGTIEDELTSK